MYSCLCIIAKRTVPNFENFVNIRHYARGTPRKPSILSMQADENSIQIASTDNTEIDHEVNKDENTASIRWRHASTEEKIEKKVKETSKKPNLNIKHNIKSITYDMLETVIDANGEFVYKKLPDKDSKITALLTSIQGSSKKEKKSIVLEGKRLIKEALQSNGRLEYIIFSRKDDIEDLKSVLPKSGATLYKIPYKEIQLWSDLTTSPGIMGIFKKPDTTQYIPQSDSIPITIICDSIREPGNLGAILRTCAGAGCENVVLTKGCVNLWDSKVMRSSCGAHFQLQIHTQRDWTGIEECLKLNSKVFIADNNIFHSSNATLEDVTFRIKSIPIIPYYGISINKSDPIVLIIGGETEGVSEEAYKLAYDLKGARLNVPLSNGIDSLNAGVALGVILFEIKKQMLLNVNEYKKETIETVR